MNLNSIIFKGTPNGILILLDKSEDFITIKKVLEKKLKENLDFFKDTNAVIKFKGKDLSEEEELELIQIISKNSGLNISFISDENISQNYKKNNDSQKTETLQNNYQNTLKPLQTSILENCNLLANTYYHKGSLRGGQLLNHNGSIVVIGDVNPGSKILAEGNIIVLGKLKGIVHAGCTGIENCFVSALYMNPTQLIINDVITYFPNDITREMVPEYAYKKNGKIFVEPLIKM